MNIILKKIAVIGIGYVGLPLSICLAKKNKVIAFDSSAERISQLQKGIDINNTKDKILNNKALEFTSDYTKLKTCDYYIITLPTPLDTYFKPDLSIIKNATKMLSKTIKFGDIIIYESTFYPGCIEEDLVPILEKGSGLEFNKDFFCGYSPERINPGDMHHNISNIIKITSGSTPEIADIVDNIYSEIIDAGTHKVKSIKIAEAAKVFENTQRDLNIALINELAIILNLMDIDTESVLKAAETKWNFHKYRPGLVGGHCIGVDPYYLTYKSKKLGYKPKIILAGRYLNDQMSKHVASSLVKEMIKRKIKIENAKILVMGLTFKENSSDIRNSKVFDLIKELKEFNFNIDAYDPYLEKKIKNDSDYNHVNVIEDEAYQAIIIAVAHNEFKEMGIEKIKSFTDENNFIYDLKFIFNKDDVAMRL